MKRLIGLLVILSLIISLTACFPTAPTTPDEPSPSIPSVQQPQKETEDPGDTNIPEVSDNPTEEQPTENAQPIAFEEIVVVDDENCTIKITNLEKSILWGYTLDIYTENKSAEKTYMFSLSSASVNGVEASTYYAEEVAPGKKSNGDITFSDSDFDYNDIGDFTDILLNFRVYDSNDWLADDVAHAEVHVYPFGEENSTQFVRETQSADTILADNEYVTVIATGYDPDDFWGWSLDLYIINKTNVSVMVAIDEAAINGYMIDPFYATSVMPNTSKFSSIDWSSSDFEENNITEVEEVEFILKVYNENDWFADEYVYERITLNP